MPSEDPGRPRGRVAAALAMAGFLYAIWGYFNVYYVKWLFPGLYVDSILVSSASEIIVIVAFGVFAIRAQTNRYTKIRLVVLVGLVATIWGAVPLLFPFAEPHVGRLPFTPVGFPGMHVPGALSYFVWLGLIFLFGRRVDCAWCCPCVGIRETVGAPFRGATIKGGPAWRLRHVQWLVVGVHGLYLAFIFMPASGLADAFFSAFWSLVPLAYYLSFLLVPVTGNRNFCRYLCPFGSVYGAVSVAGFFKIVGDPERCSGCGLCERECDMGVPVATLIRERGEVRVMDCMGCCRCVASCPRQALESRDVRDALGLRRGERPPRKPVTACGADRRT
ncbi:MAG: hypothetical protein HY815_04430 [Candidatus Riflebacteria bacterium]|nr:hypothetical protein [Candidatus Riflebacteria bacterium]